MALQEGLQVPPVSAMPLRDHEAVREVGDGPQHDERAELSAMDACPHDIIEVRQHMLIRLQDVHHLLHLACPFLFHGGGGHLIFRMALAYARTQILI